MPQTDKEEIAIITCNVMAESRNMDAAMRIKEINSAREQIGEERFLLTDESIKESLKYGLCKNLVLNDDSYSENLETLKAIAAEALRIEREKAEEERIAREKKAEEERIAREKKAEAERIAREKKAEAERIALEQAKKRYRESILSSIKDYKLEVKRAWVRLAGEEVKVTINCNNSLSGLNVNLIVKFQGGHTRKLINQRMYCHERRTGITDKPWVQDFDFMGPSKFHPNTKALMESFSTWGGSGHVLKHIKEFELRIIDGGYKNSWRNFPPMKESHHKLDIPIVLKWQNEI